jgi:hypothetical protein
MVGGSSPTPGAGGDSQSHGGGGGGGGYMYRPGQPPRRPWERAATPWRISGGRRSVASAGVLGGGGGGGGGAPAANGDGSADGPWGCWPPRTLAPLAARAAAATWCGSSQLLCELRPCVGGGGGGGWAGLSAAEYEAPPAALRLVTMPIIPPPSPTPSPMPPSPAIAAPEGSHTLAAHVESREEEEEEEEEE